MLELKDMTIGCWCKDQSKKDQSCHGDVIADFVNRAVSADRPFFSPEPTLHVG
jgi:hypothetical protein